MKNNLAWLLIGLECIVIDGFFTLFLSILFIMDKSYSMGIIKGFSKDDLGWSIFTLVFITFTYLAGMVCIGIYAQKTMKVKQNENSPTTQP